MDVVRAAIDSALNLAGLLGEPIGISVADNRGQFIGSAVTAGADSSYEPECRTIAEVCANLKLDTLALRRESGRPQLQVGLRAVAGRLPTRGTGVLVGDWNWVMYVVAVRAESEEVERVCAERAAALLWEGASDRPQLDAAELRRAMGSFVTGVVVAIAPSLETGQPVGMTATGLVSLSLEPPLLGLSIATTAKSHTAFVQSTEFTVNVLHADQADLALKLAKSGPDKFDGVDLVPTAEGTWSLAESRTVLHCRTRATIRLGDHTLVVGEIHTTNNVLDEPALLFLGGGQFAVPAVREPNVAASA